MSLAAPGIRESLEHESDSYFPDGGFHYFGIYSFHDRCGERRFLVSVGGRYDWGIGYVGNWSFYFPAGIDAEEEVVYEV